MIDDSQLKYEIKELSDYPKNRYKCNISSYSNWLLSLYENINGHISETISPQVALHNREIISEGIKKCSNNPRLFDSQDYRELFEKLNIDLAINNNFKYPKDDIKYIISNKIFEDVPPIDFVTELKNELSKYIPENLPLDVFLHELLEYAHSELYRNGISNIVKELKSFEGVDVLKSTSNSSSKNKVNNHKKRVENVKYYEISLLIYFKLRTLNVTHTGIKTFFSTLVFNWFDKWKPIKNITSFDDLLGDEGIGIDLFQNDEKNIEKLNSFLNSLLSWSNQLDIDGDKPSVKTLRTYLGNGTKSGAFFNLGTKDREDRKEIDVKKLKRIMKKYKHHLNELIDSDLSKQMDKFKDENHQYFGNL